MPSSNFTASATFLQATSHAANLDRMNDAENPTFSGLPHFDPSLWSNSRHDGALDPAGDPPPAVEPRPSASLDPHIGPNQHPDDPQVRDAVGKNRVKSAKACDECRKRKIRCSATDDQHAEPCSHCKRSHVKCTFFRQQLKRGPSKGYIKELNSRLTTLETQVGASAALPSSSEDGSALSQHVDAGAQRNPEDAATENIALVSSGTLPCANNKRSRTDFETLHHNDALSSDQNPSYSQFMFQDVMFSPSAGTVESNMLPDPTLSSTSITADAAGSVLSQRNSFTTCPTPQPFFSVGHDFDRLQSLSTPYEHDSNALPALEDWDDDVLDEYYRLIHKTFPILPHSRVRLRASLSDCPSGLRDAFLIALACLMRTFPIHDWTVRPTPDYFTYIKRAADLLASYPFESPTIHTNASNLVYLQTLIIMAMESDNHGPATVRGQAGPSRAEWLGRAAGVAGQSEIHLVRPRERMSAEGDPDSDQRIARRVWWSLFILDRWHASSTADLLRLPEKSSALLPDDQILLGESTYHLVRLSFVIGHLSAILTTTRNPATNVMAPSNPASQLLALTLVGEIDRFRESVESVWGSLNLVHLSYHHCHLLIKRLSPTTGPTELIDHAVKVATILNQRQTPITPLNHHFAALSAMTLCELVSIGATRVEARKGLAHLAEALGSGRGLAGHPSDSTGWDNAIRALVVDKLADSAASRDVDDAGVATARPDDRGFDATGLTRHGYLTALGQGWVSR